MIIWLLATSDPAMLRGVEEAAKQPSTDDYSTIAYYGTGGGSFAKVGPYEKIQLFAHGNQDEIGDAAANSTGYTPEQLATLLGELLLPAGYEGEIDVNTCDSGVLDDQRRTYVDKLLHYLVDKYQFRGSVYGYGGPVKGFSAKEVVETAGGNLSSAMMRIKAKNKPAPKH